MSRPTVTDAELADADGGPSRLARRDWAFLAVLALLVAAFLADWRGVYQADRLVFDADLKGLDWLSLYAADVLGFYFCLPLATDRERTVGYLRRIRENRLATASLGLLVAFVLVGLVGPLVFRPDRAVFGQTGGYGVPIGQPPVGFDVFRSGYCLGPKVDGFCHGTWKHPLGTTPGGKDVFGMIVAGSRVAVQISAVCVALVVPLATTVGTVAATYGGSLLLIVLVFGLLNWGGIARIVRSEALQLQEQVYVQAARSAGASTFEVVRRHVVPNTLNAVFTALTVQIGWLLLLEASLSFLGIGSATHPLWGYVLTTSVRNGVFPTFYWWGALFPTLALGLVVVAFQTLGDALRDVTDPRAE